MRSVFDLRKDIVKTYADFSKSFSKIAAADIREAVDKEYLHYIMKYLLKDKI